MLYDFPIPKVRYVSFLEAILVTRLKEGCGCEILSHRIHGTGILYIYLHFHCISHKHQPNVGEYIPYMDPYGI